MTTHEPLIMHLCQPTECVECGNETWEQCLRCAMATCTDCCIKLAHEAEESERDRLFDERSALGYL